MASGFIILKDARCLAVRGALHDAVIRSVANSLNHDPPLQTWLLSLVPSDGDVDLGHAFVRASDRAQIQRMLDLRCLTDSNRLLFENAARHARSIEGPFAPEELVTECLDRLRRMLDSYERGEPPLSLSDWTCEAPPPEGKIGPGWDNTEKASYFDS